jgi:IclR family acetate operon transcriptional repressor
MWRVERAMRILELVAAEPEGARVTDLATTLGLNRAIPHRVLAELCELGYVAQDPATQRYRATFKLGSLGLRQLETAGISQWARDELDALAATTKELVRLAVASGTALQFVAQTQGANSRLVIDIALGRDAISLRTARVSATGRAWLSTLPEDEALALLSSHGIGPTAVQNQSDLGKVVEAIAHARQVGYAIIQEEMEVGINAIATPIVPPNSPCGRAVGTLSIAGPSARVSPEALVGFVPILRAAAERLGREWHVYEYLKAISGPLASS